MPFISLHTSSSRRSQQKISASLLNTLQYYYSLILIISLSIFWKYTYLITPISKYLNTSPYFSLTKSFLLESNLNNFSSGYNPIFLLSLTSISLILPYIIHITNTTSHKKIYIFYHLHTSQEIPNTHTNSPSYGRHKSILHKALLLEGTSTPYKSPSYGRRHYS